MTRSRRPLRLLLLALLGVIVVQSGPAHAATGVIRDVTVAGTTARVVVESKGLQAAPADPQGLRVSLDDRSVPARVVKAEGAVAQGAARTAVLLVDVSGSMKGPGIAGAKTAATAFLDDVPDDVRVGLTVFSGSAQTLVRPTTDRRALRQAVASLVADGSTSLHDGVIAAARQLGGSGSPRIVLISDGADSTSSSTLADAVKALRSSRAEVVAVQYGPDTGAAGALRELAGVNRGQVVRAGDTAALTRAFRTAALDFTARVQVDVDLPADVAGETLLRVEFGQGSEHVTAERQVTLPEATAAAATGGQTKQSWYGSRSSLPWATGALFAGLLLALLLILDLGGTRAEGQRRTWDVLSRYTLQRRTDAESAPAEATALGSSTLARSAVDLAGRLVEKRGMEQRLTLALDRAAVPLTPAEWLVVNAVVCLLALAFSYLLTDSLLLTLLLGLLLGVGGPKAFLSFRAGRRQKAFLEALPDSLQLVAGALSSGYSLPQALDTVVREGTQPIGGEIGRALSEARLGVAVEDGLDAVAERMACEDFRWVVMAIRVQREVGGNLAGVLLTLAQTLRDRSKLRRQVRALSAEGRMSAWVLIALPTFLGLYEFFFKPDYFRPMYTTFPGVVMLVGTAISMVIGAVWMQKLVKVEV